MEKVQNPDRGMEPGVESGYSFLEYYGPVRISNSIFESAAEAFGAKSSAPITDADQLGGPGAPGNVGPKPPGPPSPVPPATDPARPKLSAKEIREKYRALTTENKNQQTHAKEGRRQTTTGDVKDLMDKEKGIVDAHPENNPGKTRQRIKQELKRDAGKPKPSPKPADPKKPSPESTPPDPAKPPT